MNKTITIETTVNKDMDTVWESWTTPEHIQKWAHAGSDWECTHAENDLKVEGRFLMRLAAKDGSASFDFTGAYTEVEKNKLIAYTIDDGRTVRVLFEDTGNGVHIVETLEMEHENTEEKQREGWQSMLNEFTTYTESL